MLLASQIILIIAGVLLIGDSVFMATHRPNPIKGWPLPCPITLVLLGVGVILLSVAGLM
ncbi:hypothetical protein ACFLX3_03905 [Chloroflexota bacterium]